MSAPSAPTKAPNGRLSGDGSAQARRHGAFRGSYPQVTFVPKQFLLCS